MKQSFGPQFSGAGTHSTASKTGTTRFLRQLKQFEFFGGSRSYSAVVAFSDTIPKQTTRTKQWKDTARSRGMQLGWRAQRASQNNVMCLPKSKYARTHNLTAKTLCTSSTLVFPTHRTHIRSRNVKARDNQLFNFYRHDLIQSLLAQHRADLATKTPTQHLHSKKGAELSVNEILVEAPVIDN